jgi:alpha-beta hydrolase superfamily lysophospholipase
MYTTQRQCTESTFKTHDGESLFYRHWPATPGARKGVIALFHRGHEHGGRMAHLVDELNLPQYDFIAWDARGHGKSPGQRGFSPSFATSVRDVQTFVNHICERHACSPDDIYVIAQSVGAVLISTWLHDYAPRIRGVTLASPAFKVKLYVPFARAGLALMHKIRGLFFVNSYVKAKFLTHDPVRIKSYEEDPLISRPIAVNILLDLYTAAERIVGDAHAITTPVQLLISGDDWVVHREPQERFFAGLSSPLKSMKVLPGFYHDTLGEKDRAGAVAEIRSTIEARFAQPLQTLDLSQADKHGATAEEARELSAPLLALSPEGLYWSVFRANLKLGGVLSEGIKLGHETGFDSGSTLDYVYRNEASGVPIIGKLADRNYLDAIGWRGIRQRKVNVEELLNLGASKLNAEGKTIRMMDVAAGHGRYDLDAVVKMPVQPSSILLRDYSDINVRDGAALIRSRGLQDRAQFKKADAFDCERATFANTEHCFWAL